MSKDPREGLKLRLGYEVAREIERTPVIAPGVSDAAVRAINSVLYQRLQDQITEDNPTTRILEERIRDINVTTIASEININKQDLIAVLQSGVDSKKSRLDHQVIKVPLEIKDLLELQDHPQAHQADQDLAGHRGQADQEDQLWTKRQTPQKDLPTTNHLLQQNLGLW